MMPNVDRTTARSVHATTGMPAHRLFEMVSCKAMTQVFASMVVTTTVATAITVADSVTSWAEFLADLDWVSDREGGPHSITTFVPHAWMPRLIVAAFFLTV